MTSLMTEALLDIAMERKRQIEEEGFDQEHDGLLMGGVLARQGACYATHVADYRGQCYPYPPMWQYAEADAPEDWPGPRDMWKPTLPRRDLVKAAAMILAEIDRIDRGVE